MAGAMNLEVRLGDTLSVPLQFATSRAGTTPIDLTGKTWVASVFDADWTVVASFDVSVPTPANGEMTLTLDVDATTLTVGSYRWSLKDTAGDVTLLVGTLSVLEVA